MGTHSTQHISLSLLAGVRARPLPLSRMGAGYIWLLLSRNKHEHKRASRIAEMDRINNTLSENVSVIENSRSLYFFCSQLLFLTFHRRRRHCCCCRCYTEYNLSVRYLVAQCCAQIHIAVHTLAANIKLNMQAIREWAMEAKKHAQTAHTHSNNVIYVCINCLMRVRRILKALSRNQLTFFYDGTEREKISITPKYRIWLRFFLNVDMNFLRKPTALSLKYCHCRQRQPAITVSSSPSPK